MTITQFYRRDHALNEIDRHFLTLANDMDNLRKQDAVTMQDAALMKLHQALMELRAVPMIEDPELTLRLSLDRIDRGPRADVVPFIPQNAG